MKTTAKKLALRFITACAIYITFSASAYAYLDPGSGSIILQGILGAIAAIAVGIKAYWHRITVFFGKKDKGAPSVGPEGNRDHPD